MKCHQQRAEGSRSSTIVWYGTILRSSPFQHLISQRARGYCFTSNTELWICSSLFPSSDKYEMEEQSSDILGDDFGEWNSNPAYY